MNGGSDNNGSSPVVAEDRRQLEQAFGNRYVRIQTGVHGLGSNRKQRRKARYRKPDRG